MSSDSFPNRCHADSALIIYRDAMRRYIAPILEEEYGPDWIFEQVLTGEARKRNWRSYQQRRQSLLGGTPPQDLIDLADIPFLINDNKDPLFPMIQDVDIKRMRLIRDLRNELQHSDRPGDCTTYDARAIANLCAAALEHCGLLEAANRIDQL